MSQRLLELGGWSPEERRRATGRAFDMLRWGRVPQLDGFDVATVEAVFRRARTIRGVESVLFMDVELGSAFKAHGGRS